MYIYVYVYICISHSYVNKNIDKDIFVCFFFNKKGIIFKIYLVIFFQNSCICFLIIYEVLQNNNINIINLER